MSLSPAPFVLRTLQTKDAPAAAKIVLSHFSNDPGYTYVWGDDADRDDLLKMYTGKLTRLIEDEYVQTWGAFRPEDDTLVAFAAWNPPSYTKSWNLYLRQEWARRTRGLNLPWPLSYIVPPPPPQAAAVVTGQKTRFERISGVRKSLMSKVPADPQRIWLMHFAGDDAAVDQLMREKVLQDADGYGSAIHMQTQHTEAGVARAKEAWGFEVAAEDVFEDGETRIPMWLMLRSPKK